MSLALDYRQPFHPPSNNHPDPLEILANTKAEPSAVLDTTTIIATSTAGLAPEGEGEKDREFIKSVAALKNVDLEERDAVIDKRLEANVSATNEPQSNTRDNHIQRYSTSPTLVSDSTPCSTDTASLTSTSASAPPHTATQSDRKLSLPGQARPTNQNLGQPSRHIDRLARSTRKPSSSKGGDPEEVEIVQEHLDRHVKEVRAAAPLKGPVPTREMFESVEPGTGMVKTNWIEYFKSHIRYFVNNAANDKIDALDTENFALYKLRSNAERLYSVTAPLQDVTWRLRRIYRWENKLETGFCLLTYFIIWYSDLFIPILLFGFILFIINNRVRPLEAFDPLAQDALIFEPPFATIEEKRKSRRRYPPSEERSKGVTEWWEDIRTSWGPFLQMELGDAADTLEKLKNLITWKRPHKTRIALFGLAIAFTAFFTISARLVIRGIIFLLGIEFFVLLPLQSHFPRYRRIFSITEWLLWDVPTDAEWAMEVIRKNEGVEIQTGSTKTAASTADIVGIRASGAETETGAGAGGEAGPRLTAQVQITDSDGNPIPLAPTNTTEVGSAAAEAGRVPSLNSERSSSEWSSSAPGIAEPPGIVEFVDAFGCTYKGLPGKLVIMSTQLKFKALRVVGGKWEVDLPLDDVVGVKKTKSINLLIWHTDGLEITTTSNKTLVFEHVTRRDDCFNKLIAISGKKWHRV